MSPAAELRGRGGDATRSARALALRAALAALTGLASAAGAQGGDPRDSGAGPHAAGVVTGSAGLSLSTPLMVDGNGTRVGLAPSPTLAVEVAPRGWRVGPLQAGFLLRAATGPMRLRDGAERWGGGQHWQLDVMARAGHGLLERRLTLAAGAGVTWLGATRRIAPLERPAASPAGELSAAYRPAGTRWELTLTAQGYRLDPRPGDAGGVGRLIAGVARAF